jgi:hypothetical protein
MATLSRDPLDELIVQLERSIPAAAPTAWDLPSYDLVVEWLDVILRGTPEERRFLDTNPKFESIRRRFHQARGHEATDV